jgi:hypothetical protein
VSTEAASRFAGIGDFGLLNTLLASEAMRGDDVSQRLAMLVVLVFGLRHHAEGLDEPVETANTLSRSVHSGSAMCGANLLGAIR